MPHFLWLVLDIFCFTIVLNKAKSEKVGDVWYSLAALLNISLSFSFHSFILGFFHSLLYLKFQVYLSTKMFRYQYLWFAYVLMLSLSKVNMAEERVFISFTGRLYLGKRSQNWKGLKSCFWIINPSITLKVMSSRQSTIFMRYFPPI